MLNNPFMVLGGKGIMLTLWVNFRMSFEPRE